MVSRLMHVLTCLQAGLPRTATSSLQAALIELGYSRCHHMKSVVLDIGGLGQKWKEAYSETDTTKRQAILRDILQDYDAIVDAPGCFLVDDLIEVFPTAQVILSLRSSPQQWRQSISMTLDLLWDPWEYMWTIWHQRTRYFAFVASPMFEKICMSRYNSPFFFTKSTEVYTRHNDWVRSIIPKERLLEFEPAQGWQPLCNFLKKPVPATPFPRLNEAEMVRGILSRWKREGMTYYAASLIAVLGVYLAWKWKWVVPAEVWTT